MLTKENKKEIMNAIRKKTNDTGSTAVQIALLTERINKLSDHFKKYPKDFTSKQGFLKLIGQRRKLLNYLKKYNRADYQAAMEKYKFK
jgi:small subunit ribosomal protein S15